MYKQIAKMTPVHKIYEQKLIDEGTLTADEIKNMKQHINNILEESYQKSRTLQYQSEDWVSPQWAEIMNVDVKKQIMSGIPVEQVREIGKAISTLPKEDNFHRQVRKIFDARLTSIEKGKDIDWGTAEALAFSSLIKDGYKVRISGQDVERGTFSHRHAHVFYQDRDGYYSPISYTMPQGIMRSFIACNSHLSEFAVLGYELGYSMCNPNTLNLWEAQFGDFANGA